MKIMIPLIIIYFCFSAIYSNAQDATSQENDKVIKEIALSSFETVDAEGGGDIYVHYSTHPRLEIKGLGSCVENTGVKVSSNTLNITRIGDFLENCRVEIHIFTPILKEIRQDGGGRIVIKEGFAPVDAFKCSIDGGGDIKMTALSVNSLLATIEGGGEISAQVHNKLNGKIRGGGMILYQGDPNVESNISGGGAIKRKWRYEK